MRTEFVAFLGIAVSLAGLADVMGQASRPAPAFEVVSIRRSVPEPPRPGEPPVSSSVQERPDGGVTFTNIDVAFIIARAFPPTLPKEIVGLPGWARSDRYNVRATSSLPSATRDDRLTMLRSMLFDRFRLAVHTEMREQPVFDLVLARRDGKLGPGLTPLDVPCAATGPVPDAAAEKPSSPPQMPDFKAPPPPCTFRIVGPVIRDRFGDGKGKLGDLLEGEGTIASLAEILDGPADRPIVDKTGLAGAYRVAMNFDMFGRLRGPALTPSPDAAPSVFAAVEQQLGLKLESSRQFRETLVVDRLERPTDN